jgi:DNA modification methylase
VNYRLINADAVAGLRLLPDASVQCVVTSPPYWGLRDYGMEGQIGLERTPDEFVSRLVDVFREVRRVLADDGTLWLNLGDSYAGSGKGEGDTKTSNKGNPHSRPMTVSRRRDNAEIPRSDVRVRGLKPKDIVGVPWLAAFALRVDGWYLRQDIIWSKPNPMPESVTDRCTKAHEYLFLLSKSARYFYDAEAIKEDAVYGDASELKKWPQGWATEGDHSAVDHASTKDSAKKNRRSVWSIPTEPFPEAHFATFPTALVEPCILAGTRVGDTVLDPFNGSGTTGVVALSHQRNYIGIELNREYVAMSRRRLSNVAPLLAAEVGA